MIGRIVREPNGRMLELAELLARGAEGSVFFLKALRNELAKISQCPAADYGAKIGALIEDYLANGPLLGHGFEVVTPQRLLCDATGKRCVGYTMRRVTNALSWEELSMPSVRTARRLDLPFAFRVRAARNLARCVHAVCCRGHVIRDLHGQNVLVLPDGSIALIDADSMQVRFGGRTFGSAAWSEKCSPVEWHHGAHATDAAATGMFWSLMVMIFMLFNDNQHPFPPDPFGPTANLSLIERVRHGEFAYLQSAKSPAKLRLRPLASLSYFERDLYETCFTIGRNDPSSRPPAIVVSEVMEALERSLTTKFHGFRHWPSAPSAKPRAKCSNAIVRAVAFVLGIVVWRPTRSVWRLVNRHRALVVVAFLTWWLAGGTMPKLPAVPAWISSFTDWTWLPTFSGGGRGEETPELVKELRRR